MVSVSYLLMFLSVVLSNNGERWYSATVIDSGKLLNSTEQQPVSKLFQEDEEHFIPITGRLTDYENPDMENRWHFVKRQSNRDSSSRFQNRGPKRYKNKDARSKRFRKLCMNQCDRSRKSKSKGSKTRFLEVFQVVEFEHASCTSSSGLEGTCLHEYECQGSGGVSMGSCADGYGTCCVSILPCDSESSAVMGWFTNPDYPLPSTDRLSCAVVINKASEDITQMRLDFTSFELLPASGGVCQDDQFIVSGQNINNPIPILCGINTGQHVYIELSESEGPIHLSIQTAKSENRLFSIRVSQLTSSDKLAAPPGCLQYFTEPNGYLESFSNREQSDIGIARTPSYLNNLNYAICIERASGSCSITYINAGYMQIVNYDTDGLPVIPPGQAGVEIFNCPSDWLLISATRLCGDRLNDGSVIQDFSLNAPIIDNNAGPIVVWFRSDEGYVGRGFKLQYQQNPCTSI